MTEPLWRRLRRLHGPDPRADVRDEFAFHLDERTEALMTRGWPEAAAREEALRQFGDLAGAQATCTAIGNQRLRRARVRQRLETFTQDVRYAVRFLRRAPGFTTVAILSLGLGIGANTAVFSLVDAVLIRSLPVRDPGSLVQLMAIRGQGIESPAVSYPDYLAIRDRATVLADVAAMTPVGALSMRRGNSLLETLPRGGLLATGNYFAMLGVRPHLGRLLQPEDTRVIGGAPVVVLGHEFWRQRFGADSSIVGQPLSINDTPYTVVGVAPREFFGTQVGRNPDVYLPVTMAAAAYRDPDMSLGDAGSANFYCLGRLESGVDAAHAAAELSAIFAQVQLAAFGDRAGAEERRQLGRLRLETRPARSGLMYLRYR